MFEPLGPLHLFTHKIMYEDIYAFLCYDSLLFSNFRLESRPQLVVVSGLSMGIPLTVGFRPQLVVVSCLLVGIPLMVGFRPQLVVVLGLLVVIPLTMGFKLSRSLRLSRSPFHEFFPWWSLGYYGASSQIFLSYDGISPITEPFQTFLAHNGIFGYHGAFSNFSFTRWNFWLSRSLLKLFWILCHDGIHKTHKFGGRLFSYISQRVFT
jgi:hypothetical protein